MTISSTASLTQPLLTRLETQLVLKQPLCLLPAVFLVVTGGVSQARAQTAPAAPENFEPLAEETLLEPTVHFISARPKNSQPILTEALHLSSAEVAVIPQEPSFTPTELSVAASDVVVSEAEQTESAWIKTSHSSDNSSGTALDAPQLNAQQFSSSETEQTELIAIEVSHSSDNSSGTALDTPQLSVQQFSSSPETKQIAQTTEVELLEERLRQLEAQQQQLIEELGHLRQQLVEQSSDLPADTASEEMETDVTVSDNAELEAIAIETSDRPQGLYLSGEVLLLQPNPSNEIDFAIEDPGEALAVSGEVATVDYDLNANTRIAVGYRKDNVDVRVTWLELESDGEASSERPDDGFLFSTLVHPTQNDEAETAEARLDLNYTTTDLEVGYALQAGRNIDVRLAAGLRFADTNQDLQLKYDGVDFTDATARFEHDFAGFGPKLGLDARWKMGSGFSAFGRATGALLMGDSRSVYRETDNSRADLVALLEQRNNDKIIPMAEMAIGLDWTGQVTDNIGLGLSVGYEYQNWFNAYSEPRFVDDSSPGLFSSNEVDMGFQGFFVKTGIHLDF